MKTKTYTVYKFNELPQDVQEKVIQNWYEHEDYPFLEDDLLEELNQLDTLKIFSDIKLQYSLGYCQGDGLSFKASINLENWLKHKKFSKKKIERITDAIYNPKSTGNTGHYCYASESDIELDFQIDTDDKLEIEVESIRKDIASYYLDICHNLEKTGYAILDYRMTIDEFNELAEANDYDFTIDGKID